MLRQILGEAELCEHKSSFGVTKEVLQTENDCRIEQMPLKYLVNIGVNLQRVEYQGLSVGDRGLPVVRINKTR